MTEMIKRWRLKWAGHAWRIQYKLIKAILEQNPRGRSKIRWEDLVKKNMHSL